MRTSFLIAGWSLILLVLPVERAAGQLPDNAPGVFFSPSANVSSDGKPVSPPPLRQLNLRYNQVAGFHVYVHNPNVDKAKVKVQLVSGPKDKLVVAAEQTVEVEGKKNKHVSLVADKAQLPPVLPPAIGADGKPVPAPLPAIALQENVRVRVLDADDKIVDTSGPINFFPRDDIASKISAKAEGDVLRITVSIAEFTPVNRPLGKPIPVKLTPRTSAGEPVDSKLLAGAGNVLEGNLAIAPGEDGSAAVELILNTKGLPPDGFADVSVDGYARARMFKFTGDPINEMFGVNAPAVAIPGKPIAIRLMDSGKAEGKVAVVFDRTGSPTGEEVRYVNAGRDESIAVRVGENGEVVFVTKSEDWSVEFPTQGVTGPKKFFARRGKTDSEKATVMFDSTPPVVGKDDIFAEPLELKKGVAPAKYFAPGQDVRVVVLAKDGDSKIDPASVVLYMGEKPGADGKAAPGTQVKAATFDTGDRYTAVFRIPATTNTPEVKIGAIFTNGVGMTGGGEGVVRVDITPPEVSVLKFEPPPKDPLAGFKPGATVRLIASAVDGESGIDPEDEVVFFLGDPPGPDGKDVQTTYLRVPSNKGYKAEKAGDPFRYAADIPLPKEIKKETEVKVGVMFKNRAGQFGTRVATVKLDKDFTHATINVKVTQGSADRRQPGIKVWLVDQHGVVAAEGKTDECGLTVFERVLPGTYLVWGVKDADQNAQDYKTVVVRGGDEKDVGLSVRRQLSPPIQPPKQPQR